MLGAKVQRFMIEVRAFSQHYRKPSWWVMILETKFWMSIKAVIVIAIDITSECSRTDAEHASGLLLRDAPFGPDAERFFKANFPDFL